uniref:Rec21/ENK19 domain-containing protein n=1 Tax=Rhinolophus ferrumequinum TaxID=59479 RepID=A0A671FWZ0_RHIFE
IIGLPLAIKTDNGPAYTSANAQPLTWGQLKKLAHMAENKLIEKGVPKTDVNMFLSMLAVISVVSCLVWTTSPPMGYK